MVEMVIAILIGSILTSIALSGLSSAQSGYATRGARTMYASLHARARAHGIERGENVMMHVDATGDSAWIEHDGEVLEMIHFDDAINVDLRVTGTSPPSSFTLCFTPRGYTDPDCNTLSAGVRIGFWRGAVADSLFLLPFGQLVGL